MQLEGRDNPIAEVTKPAPLLSQSQQVSALLSCSAVDCLPVKCAVMHSGVVQGGSEPARRIKAVHSTASTSKKGEQHKQRSRVKGWSAAQEHRVDNVPRKVR